MNFYKYQGCGNDFIILDGRKENLNPSEEWIAKVCHRRFGIGADGLMILEPSEQADFQMKYFNSDGKSSTFCGNGGRCIVRFAQERGIISETANFLFDGNLYSAHLHEDLISLKMQDVLEIENNGEDFVLDTGSPHYVHFEENIDEIDLLTYARKIRYSDTYPKGINVNLVQKDQDHLYMRTYERGVEDETYSCGTGVVAAALASVYKNNSDKNTIAVHTKGGNFEVKFRRLENGFQDIHLIGPAEFVFQGNIDY